MIEEVTILEIGGTPTTFTIGINDVAGFELSGTASAALFVQVNYSDNTYLLFCGVPYQAKFVPAVI